MSPQMKQFLTLAAEGMGKSRLIELRAWSSLQWQRLEYQLELLINEYGSRATVEMALGEQPYKVVVVVVGVQGSDGPGFHAVEVLCRASQYDCGDHYDAAKEAASDLQYDPEFAVDEFDPGFAWFDSRYVDCGNVHREIQRIDISQEPLSGEEEDE